MMPILEQRASASSMLCVVSTTVDYLRCVDRFEMTVHMNRLAYGSTPVDGSSSKISGGLPISAIAQESLRLLPPLSLPACRSRYYHRSSSLICIST